MHENKDEMNNSFEQSRKILSRFQVEYDINTHKIYSPNENVADQKKPSNLQEISYFSDFISMQQLMATEIEILLGKNSCCDGFHPEDHFKEFDEAEIE